MQKIVKSNSLGELLKKHQELQDKFEAQLAKLDDSIGKLGEIGKNYRTL